MEYCRLYGKEVFSGQVVLDEGKQFETAPVRRDFYQIVKIQDVEGIMATTFDDPPTRGSGSYLYLLAYLNSPG